MSNGDETNGICCHDCNDTGLLENRAEGKYPCTCMTECEPYQVLEATVKSLWQIIDDIDTYGDMAKSDDKLFRELVENRQKDRWKTGVATDGYTLKLPCEGKSCCIIKVGEESPAMTPEEIGNA